MSIDDLLSQPLPTVADSGFSARIIGRVRAAERRRIALISAGSAAAVGIACFLIPLQTVAIALNKVVVDLGTSTAVGVGGAVLLLTILFDRRFFRL